MKNSSTPSGSKKLHLACGDVYLQGWLNVDLDSPKADMHLDLTKPLPFSDGSMTHIFSEHFVEHILRSDAVNFLMECRRVLSVNGVLRISTPNLRFLAASYLAGNKDEWGDLWMPETLCLMMNEGMRLWGHQFVYDFNELIRVFIEAGFISISSQEYGKSHDRAFCNLESRPFHNELIVEARKIENGNKYIDDLAIKKQEDQWLIGLEDESVVRLYDVEQRLPDRNNHVKNLERSLHKKILSRLLHMFRSAT